MAEEGSGERPAGSSEFSSQSGESDSRHLEFTKWLTALEANLKVTQATRLELKSKQIGVKEAAEICRLLPNSQVVDLGISCNENLRDGVEDLARFLSTSKIEKLSLCRCLVSEREFLHLIGILKNTHVSEIIVNYDNCIHFRQNCFEFDSDEEAEFMSHVRGSRFIRLECQGPSVTIPLLSIIQESSITHLNISGTTIPADDLSLLFSSLRHTAITDLKLYKTETEMSKDGLQELSVNLRDSKLVNLTLSCIDLSNAQLDILADGLVHSKISSLDISGNRINGANSFGRCLQDSQIVNLNLSYNPIASHELLSFPLYLKHSSVVKLDFSHCSMSDRLCKQLIECLKFSKVTHLVLSHNQVELLSVIELASVLKYTALNSVDFSFNPLSPKEVELLADCLKSSKLQSISVSNRCDSHDEAFVHEISMFLHKTKNTSIDTVDLSFNSFGRERMNLIAAGLVNSTFTHLNLRYAGIGDSIVSFAPQLKLTAITYLNLDENKLCDAGAEVLSRYIPESQIVKLFLSHNHIGDCGATVLASCFKRSKLVHLDLSHNKIGNEGLESLAKNAEGTFLKTLDVSHNEGNRDLLIDRVLLENQTSVHHFVSFFKEIVPETNENNFRFDNIMDGEDVEKLLEGCLLFYNVVVERPSVVSVLVAEDSLALSMKKCVKLLEEEFPRQFTALVLNQIEASLEQHVSILKKAEELKLEKVVEVLLLNRPAFMIDQDIGIMHPYVYQLLHKYKQPLYNLSIEPKGKTKIIDYFTKHPNLDGASDVVNILNSKCEKET